MQYKTLAILLATTALADEIDKLTSDADLVSLETYPTWVLDAKKSAEPTAWASSFANDPAFASSVLVAYNAETFPAWYSNMPESVQVFESTRREALQAYAATATQDWITFSDSSTSAATAATASPASASSSSNTGGTSVSTGGAPAMTGDIIMGLAGAAGILGLAVAL